jgi:hypothetical protein
MLDTLLQVPPLAVATVAAEDGIALRHGATSASITSGGPLVPLLTPAPSPMPGGGAGPMGGETGKEGVSRSTVDIPSR